MYSKQLNRWFRFLRTHQSLARSKFPLCPSPAAGVGPKKKLLEGGCFQRVCRDGYAWDVLGMAPCHPSSGWGARRGAAVGATPQHPLPRALRWHPQGQPQPLEGGTPLPAGRKAPCLAQANTTRPGKLHLSF